MPLQCEGPLPGDIDRMTRHELISALLELNKSATFQFTHPWLRKQWTGRLRSLLRSARAQAEPVREQAASPAGEAAVEDEKQTELLPV